MLNKISDTLRVLKIVYLDKKYINITLISAVILFVTLYFVALSGMADYSLRSFIGVFGVTHVFFTFLVHLIIGLLAGVYRSEEHTSELQSHSFISYAVFCLKKKISTFVFFFFNILNTVLTT